MPWRKAAATCDAPNNHSARLAAPPKPGAAASLAITGASPARQGAWGCRGPGRGAGWGMSAAHRTSPPLQRWWRGWRWRRRRRTAEAATAAAAVVAASAAAAAAAATPRAAPGCERWQAGGRRAAAAAKMMHLHARGRGGVRQREGAQARPLGADGEEGRRAGRSPAVHPRRRCRQTRSWRRERLPGASPPLGDCPRPRRRYADGGPKPGG